MADDLFRPQVFQQFVQLRFFKVRRERRSRGAELKDSKKGDDELPAIGKQNRNSIASTDRLPRKVARKTAGALFQLLPALRAAFPQERGFRAKLARLSFEEMGKIFYVPTPVRAGAPTIKSYVFFNFVLFVTFVVESMFVIWLRLCRARASAPLR